MMAERVRKIKSQVLALQSRSPAPVVQFLIAALTVAALFGLLRWSVLPGSPARAAEQFSRAVYARDYPAAWEWIAEQDQQVKTRQAYLAENASFDGLKLDLTYQLAEWIEFVEVSVDVDGSQATVNARVRVPNGNQAEVVELLRAAEPENRLSDAERADLMRRLQALYQQGELEFLEGDESFRLTRQGWNWRVSMGWDRAIHVRLIARVAAGLEWDFYPLQEEVLALPGETLTATYRAVNRSDQRLTGKAKHALLPEVYERYITTVQCFCFIQQTLEPGESRDMQMVFRIAWDIPDHVRGFENRYVFYPIEAFPQD